jgi:hypothetical protein
LAFGDATQRQHGHHKKRNRSTIHGLQFDCFKYTDWRWGLRHGCNRLREDYSSTINSKPQSADGQRCSCIFAGESK